MVPSLTYLTDQSGTRKSSAEERKAPARFRRIGYERGEGSLQGYDPTDALSPGWAWGTPTTWA